MRSILLLASLTFGGQLETFQVPRNNLEGSPLWSVYQGEEPDQVGRIDSGMFIDSTWNTSEPHIHFMPRGTNGYAGAGGRLRDYALDPWDSTSNRLSFWMSVDKDVPRSATGGRNIEFGTYFRPTEGGDRNYQGAHYYHLAGHDWKAGAWYRVDLTPMPQHRVGMDPATNWEPIPGYFHHLTRWYIDAEAAAWHGATVRIKDVTFSHAAGEPDSEIATLVYGYDGSAYSVSWAGRKGYVTLYEVRTATRSMKANGWEAGEPAGEVRSPGNSYTGCAWRKVMPAVPGGLFVGIRVQGSQEIAEVFIRGPKAPEPVLDTLPPPPPPVVICRPDTVVKWDTVVIVRRDTLYVMPRAFQLQPVQ